MERGAGGGQQQQHQHQQQQQHHLQQHQHQHVAAVHSYDYDYDYDMTPAAEYTPQSSFDNPATKRRPPKLKAISRSLSMAIDNYAPQPGDVMLHDDNTLIVEQPLIHRSASPIGIRSAPPPQSLALPQSHHFGGSGSGSVSPALSARHRMQQQQQHHQQQQQQQQKQQQLHAFQHLAAKARHSTRSHHHSSSASSPTSHAVSPVLGGSTGSALSAHQQQPQPDIYLVSSSSLGDDIGALGVGGSTSPIQFIDDYMLPSSSVLAHRHTATHPFKKTMFRRSDTIDVHPASTFQMKKTHSFHAQQDPATMEKLLLAASAIQGGSGSSSRRTSSVRANFLMPGHPAAGKDISRSPSPSRRGCRSHRSFNDPSRRPSPKPESVVESQIRHPSLNDDLMEGERSIGLFTPTNLSLENELFVESRSRSNSHTKMDDVGSAEAATHRAIRKSSGSFEEAALAAGAHTSTHPPVTTSSLKKREHPHSRQHSSHSLELDGRPSTSAAATAAAAAAAGHMRSSHTMQLHSAATAAQAAYHFKRGAQHGRSLYLSPNNLEELQVHRPSVLAAAAAFQGTNASAKQAKALHSASMRLRTYRETLSATKKSKSFIGDAPYPTATATGNEFELTSPHRRNSRPLSSAVPNVGSGTTTTAATIEDIKRSPRPMPHATTSVASAIAGFMDEKRPSFERKPSLTYELSDAAFEQVLRPFHHKMGVTPGGRKTSLSGAHKALKKKSLSDETDEEEEADRKRKRIVCIVMTVFLCLVCASVLVVILTLTHTSGQSHHHLQTSKKVSISRETPVHYNVRQENERLMRETMERFKTNKTITETTASLIAAHSPAIAQFANLVEQRQQEQVHQAEYLQQHEQQVQLLQQIP